MCKCMYIYFHLETVTSALLLSWIKYLKGVKNKNNLQALNIYALSLFKCVHERTKLLKKKKLMCKYFTRIQ